MKPVPDRDRQFGISVGAVLIIIAALLAWRGRVARAEVVAVVGGVLLTLGYVAPRLLKYPSAAWWAFAKALGYVNARVILTLIFALVLVPLGVIWRVIGRDPLGRRRAAWGGWSAYPARYRDRAHYKRMF